VGLFTTVPNVVAFRRTGTEQHAMPRRAKPCPGAARGKANRPRIVPDRRGARCG
jgi:hypothetical protein